MTGWEIAATLFGLACVYFTIREKILCWPTGLVQVFIFIYIFYNAKLYSDLILHVIYVGLQIYGWHSWLHGGDNRTMLPMSRLALKSLFIWVGAILVVSALQGFVMYRFTDAALPYPDAFTTVASLAAQWLLTRKRLDSWYFWIAVDVVAIGVYLAKGLYVTSGLYAVFLVMAVTGLISWRRALTQTSLLTPSLAEVP